MRKVRRQRGQALPLFAFCMIALIGFMGLAIDMGYLRLVKRKMQSAADSAAIAGALQLKIGGYAAAAQADAAADGYTNGSNGTVVTVNNPVTTGSHTGAAYVEVVVSQPQPTFFMRIFGVNSAAMSARAVAALGSSSTGCIYALRQTGTAMTTVGNVDLEAPTCGIVDNGDLTVSGNVTLHAGSIGVNGSYSANGNVTVTPTPKTGIAEVSDPLAYLTQPTVGSCSAFPSTSTVNPGTYCSISISGNKTVNFNPGTYITTGGMSVTGNVTINGTGGVTIYVDSGGVSFAGNTNLNLTAPTTGPNAGILFWQNPADTNGASMLGNNTSNLTGALYFPKAQLDMGGNNDSGYTIIVADTIRWHGNANIGSNYASLGNGSPIKDAVLVE